MGRFVRKKEVLIPIGVVVGLAVAGIAGAYFTNLGSGTGTAAVGSSSSVTLHGTVASALFPGSSSTVTFTIDNPSPGSEFVNTIHLASITPDAGHSGCSTVITGGNPDFTMADVSASQGFPPGNGQAVTATGTLLMHETGVNQDACQGATLTLNLTSS
ncbi:MAG TPA: hypothetical protein VID29_08535 [Solirubrobacteraceae bacterium]|jgi:hypothetical protein